ncbi:MAG: hypothetical protein HQL98_04480 [Magnetococcales bacterium]|nr:hypothetical protein [Magnetococcales bacterium]
MVGRHTKVAGYHNNFLVYMYSYIESGFPVFGILKAHEHAVAIVGHGPLQPDWLSLCTQDECISSFQLINSLVVNDDNNFPYKLLGPVKEPDEKYAMDAINGFLVPLPEKIFLSAERVDGYMNQIFTNLDLNWFGLDLSFLKGRTRIVRYFIATSYSYKSFLCRMRASIKARMVNPVFLMDMPKYIWIVEVSDAQSYGKQECLLRFVLDATASDKHAYPFFMVHDRSEVVVFDRSQPKIVTLRIKLDGEPFTMPMYTHNLNGI